MRGSQRRMQIPLRLVEAAGLEPVVSEVGLSSPDDQRVGVQDLHLDSDFPGRLAHADNFVDASKLRVGSVLE